jgi:tetratricopeptide (TPR) repeat protein
VSPDATELDSLERWLAGELSEDEAARLEQRLQTDDELAARLGELQERLALGDELRAALGPARRGPSPLGDEPIELPDYELLGELARGGQGVVHRARQRSTGRDVALKVLHSGPADSARTLARFEREIDLVASLSHPHVVKVFDRGLTADGLPYVVMELVDGRPLDLAVADAALDLHGRLALFDKVCAAVACAHRHGVIHRDLKPANVLVDAEGEPHVLDFGLAKEHGASELTGLTAPGEFVGTLGYAAPEQLDGDPTSVDARVDVYALGVMLYRLLTGSHPFPAEGSLASVVRHVLETEPPPPRRVTPGLPAVAPGLDDDLDALVLTCLAKSPDQRYATVEALRDDLGRWERSEPLAARSDRRGYVLAKTLRRYRVPLAALAIVLVALTAATIVSTLALGDARRQAARAHALNAFLVDSLGEATPGFAPRDRTVVEWMLQAADDIEGRFGDDEVSESTLRATIAWVLRVSGEFDAAEHHATRALELFERSVGLRSREALGVRRTLAELAHERGDLALAEERFASLLADAEGVFLDAEPERASLLRALASLRIQQYRAEDAVASMRDLLPLLEQEHGPRSADALATRHMLAMALRLAGEGDESLQLWDGLVATYEESLGGDHAKTLVARSNRANLLTDMGRLDEATAAWADVAERQERSLGPYDPGTLQTRVSRAGLLSRMGRKDDALAAFLELAETCRTHLGDRNGVTLQALQGLGSNLRLTGRAETAVGILEQTLEHRRATSGEDHEATIQITLELAIALQQTGQPGRAEPLLQDARVRAERVLGSLDPTATASLFMWAMVRLDQGEPADAAQAFGELVQRTRAVEGEDSWRAWRYVGQRGYALMQLGDDEAARAELEQAWDGLAATLGSGASHARTVARYLATLADKRDDRDALELWNRRATEPSP